MFGLGIPEILIIVIAAGILLFGGKKMIDLAHSAGRMTGEFKKGRMEMDKELNEAKKDIKGDDEPTENPQPSQDSQDNAQSNQENNSQK